MNVYIQEKWDPSKIIETPFPSFLLAYLSATAFLVSLLYNITIRFYWRFYKGKSSVQLRDMIQKLLFDTLLIFVTIWITFFLCGMHPFHYYHQSICACLYVTHLLLCPSELANINLQHASHEDSILGISINSNVTGNNILPLNLPILDRLEKYMTNLLNHLLLNPSHHQTHNIDMHKDEDIRLTKGLTSSEFSVVINLDLGYRIRRYCILLAVMGCMILRLLDRGLQIQRWSLPIFIGSTCGFIFGSIVHLLFLYCA